MTIVEAAAQKTRSLVVLAVIALAIGWVGVSALDAGLEAMHKPNGVASAASDVASPKALVDPSASVTAVESWSKWKSSSGNVTYLSVAAALRFYFVIDVLLIALPLTTLLLAGLSAPSLTASSSIPVVRGGRICAAIFLAVDLIEDGMLLVHYEVGNKASALFLGGSALIKWLMLGAALLAWLYAILRLGQGKLDSVRDSVPGTSEKNLWATVLALRAPALIVAVLVGVVFLPGDVGLQVADVFIDLPSRLIELTATVVALVLFTLLLIQAGIVTARAYESSPILPTSPLLLRRWAKTPTKVLGATALLSAVLGYFVGISFWWAWLPPAVICLAFVVLTSLASCRNAKPGPGLNADMARVSDLLHVLVAIPLVVVGLGFFRGAITLLLVRHYVQAVVMLVISVVLWLLATRTGKLNFSLEAVTDSVTAKADAANAGEKKPERPWFALALVVGFAGGVWPIAIGEFLGPLAVIFLFLGALLAGTTALVLLSDRNCARGVLALVGLRRVPFLTFVVLCALATSYLNTSGHYHDATLQGEVDQSRVQQRLKVTFDAWITQQENAVQDMDKVNDRARVPMVFIASAGGGIRAAYWGSLTTDCLFRDVEMNKSESDLVRNFVTACASLKIPDGAYSNVFAASGVSGGSVGLAVAHAVQGGRPVADAFEDSKALGPLIAALAFRDLPNAVMHLDAPWDDRARVLEMTWERAEPTLKRGFADASQTSTGEVRFPLLLLNGATVEAGCRFTTSVLDLSQAPSSAEGDSQPSDSCLTVAGAAGPDPDGMPHSLLARTRDLYDYSCLVDDEGWSGPHDMSMSTAAHLSARFPYVSPSGGLTSCSDNDRRTFVLDGGLIDSSAASPLIELFAVVAPWIQEINSDSSRPMCVVPRIILIDNGYVDSAAAPYPRRPQELLAPINATLNANGSITPAARQAAAISVQSALGSVGACTVKDGEDPDMPTIEDSVAHLYPRLHPGPLAPLGWSLSRWAQEDLREQLTADGSDSGRETDNLDELSTISRWFSNAEEDFVEGSDP